MVDVFAMHWFAAGHFSHNTDSRHVYLVGGWPTPLKNMKVSWAYCSQYIEQHKIMFQTTKQLYIYITNSKTRMIWTNSCALLYNVIYIKYIQCEAPKIAKLVNMTPITMVYGTQITIVTGAYKPTNITGGPHIVWLSLQPLATNKSPLTPRWQICGHSRGIFSQRTAGGQRDWDELHPPVAALDDVVLVPSSLRKSLPNPCWLLDEATKHSDTWRWLYMATKLVRHWTMSQHGPSSGTFYTSW